MSLHGLAFGYLKPSFGQLELLAQCSCVFRNFASELDALLPDGPDKTYVMRLIRDAGMWSNVCLTRNADGSPRS